MQCENGYTKPGVKGILCRKCEEPKENDLKSVAHALCGHQRFCPNQRCYTMLPGWEKCVLRDDTSSALRAPSPQGEGESREEGAGEVMPAKKGKRTAKKRARRKPLTGNKDLIHRIPAGHAERSPFPVRGEG